MCYNEKNGKENGMEEKTKNRARDLLYGILLAFIFSSLIFSVAAIVFSEYKEPNIALTITLSLSFLSAAIYWILESCVFCKNKSSAFSIGYFGTIVVLAAFTFFVTSVFPIYFVFDYAPTLTAFYLKTACVRFCLFNAAALVIRLGIETYRYIRQVFGYKSEQ